jgi:Sec-independent protein translocase protein TatA
MPDFLLILIVILILVVIWRGPKTLPSLGAAFGRGVREAREEAAKAQSEIQARTTSDEAVDATETAGADRPPPTTPNPPTTA